METTTLTEEQMKGAFELWNAEYTVSLSYKQVSQKTVVKRKNIFRFDSLTN